jgi:glycosyltransferase involved in cell wall biosynthesis
MRVALVFDDLIQVGGAEKLLLALHELYPTAPIYTSVASEAWLQRCAFLGINLKTSRMQSLPFKLRLNRFYGLLGLHALAFESFNFDEYDVVLSLSARFAHGIITKPGTVHVCYMNSPGRMFWEPWDYFAREGLLAGFLGHKLVALSGVLLAFRRLADYVAAQRVDYFIANALTPQARIAKYYRRSSKVIYPFAAECVAQDCVSAPAVAVEPYFVVVTRLAAWKRVDLAIAACKQVGVKLKIIGAGPDRRRLESVALGAAAGQVEFLGHVSEQTKCLVLGNCQALIMTQKEDFGLTALEAMALGKPVIAYRAGGALETVLEGVTGEFFTAQETSSLAETLVRFKVHSYNPNDCKQQAGKFTKSGFMLAVDEFVKKVYDERYSL